MKKILILLFTVSLLWSNNDKAMYLKKYKNEKKVALVIGNSNYSGTLSKLKNPTNDARDVRKALEDIGFEVLYLTNGTRRNMLKSLKDFSNKLQYAGIGLFYFSGHGIEVNKKNYLMPIGNNISNIADVEFESVSVARIIKNMQQSRTRLNMVVLDACRNDPFHKGTGAGGLSSSSADGTLIAYATKPGGVAEDNSNEQNGMYTKHFLKYIKKANLNQRDFFYKIRESVYKDTNGRQRPYVSDGTLGDFYFVVDDKIDYVKKTNDKTNQELLERLAKLEKQLQEQNKKEKVSVSRPTKVGVTSSKNIWQDPKTKLIWQNDGNYPKKDWEGAKKYCKNLTLDGIDSWRLPSINELKSILTKNSKGHGDYIKKELVENMPLISSFWSSTSYNLSDAWLVLFLHGDDFSRNKSNDFYVLCVADSSL
jgi:hypothetical protein